MLQRVAAILRDHCRIAPPAVMIVAVSGGPDSLCLMHLLREMKYRLIVAHVDHRLRAESAADAIAVEQAAAALGLQFVMQRFDVRAHAQSMRLSIEDAAREVRYRFLFDQARQKGAEAVAVGHTADDQVETVLMHLIRGAGMSGLKGMAYRTLLPGFDATVPLLRPLLGEWRRSTVDYCASHSLAPRHDRSNDSDEYMRNRVRHDLMPMLESYNPQVREAIWRTAQTVASDLAIVEEHIGQAWQLSVVRQGGRFICFDPAELARRTVAVRRRLFSRAAKQLLPEVEIGFEALERAAGFSEGPPTSHMDLGGGLALFREAGAVYVSLGRESLPTDEWPQMGEDPVPIPPGHAFTLPLANGWVFSADFSLKAEALPAFPARFADAFRVFLDADELPSHLQLRPPRPGDRFQPLGLERHTQKLSDFFVNAKMPKRARGRWPLLCSGQTLVWVPGYRPAEGFKLRRESRRAACFTLSHAAKDNPGPAVVQQTD